MADRTLNHLVDQAAAGRRAAKTIRALDRLHQPIDRDGPTPQACQSCVAGYDPATGQLVNCAWPCPSARILQVGHHG